MRAAVAILGACALALPVLAAGSYEIDDSIGPGAFEVESGRPYSMTLAGGETISATLTWTSSSILYLRHYPESTLEDSLLYQTAFCRPHSKGFSSPQTLTVTALPGRNTVTVINELGGNTAYHLSISVNGEAPTVTRYAGVQLGLASNAIVCRAT